MRATGAITRSSWRPPTRSASPSGLILEPQAELNLYTRDDPARRIGSGASSLDAGLRLRYEVSRKFGPYVGLTYEKSFARTADYVRTEGGRPDDLRFTAGVRSWF